MPSMFDPVVLELTWLGLLAVAGMLGVVALVVADGRWSRPNATVALRRPPIRKAA